MIHFVCVRVGTAYSAQAVAIWADMVARNASTLDTFSIWCVTDAPDELPEGVGYIPADPTIPPSWWAKLQLFSATMPWAEGERVVYMDLDVCVTGRLEDLAERKGIIRDWNWPCFNSSVMVWDHGEHRAAWECFDRGQMTAPGPIIPADVLPAGQVNGGDQEWLTWADIQGIDRDVWEILPAAWCRSYRADAQGWPPSGCKVVVFHGRPKPADVTDGWVPDVYKIGGFTSLPEMRGVNVTHDALLENIRANVGRDLPWFTGFGPHKGVAAIVGGAPSVRRQGSAIRAHKRRGARLISVNNAWRVLVDFKLSPDVHVMLDARPENVAFLEGAPADCRYLIASQCHPSLFDALEGRDVVMWHNAFGDNEALNEALAPYRGDGPDQKPCLLVPGGGTVGLRTLWLAAMSGFRVIHVYGMDSSYEGSDHHAYPQVLNDGERTLEVTMGGRRYVCAPWMARQAEEFRETWNDLRRYGIAVHVHGEGLLPDLARSLWAEARAMEAA